MNENPVVLLIEDEPPLRRLLRLTLEPQGYRVFEAETGQLGLQEAAARRPDVIILDLGLPDLDGVTVLQRLREWSTVPVLVLSVRNQETDKVRALDHGADDYLTKPFGTGELLARLRAVQRRAPEAGDPPERVLGELTVDLSAHRVTVRGKPVTLTATEYALLRELARHAGKIITHRQLLRAVWGPNAEHQAQYLRVYATHLRQKLQAADWAGQIKNEPGIGYRLLAED
jgi:two-component system, OmpR family, KDP operon response regulator KdpE